jgi:hypothetical protein
METQSIPKQNGIYCSTCGHLNPSWRSECAKCLTKLGSPDKPAYARAQHSTYTHEYDRPGCVTAYAILMGIAAGILGILGLVGGLVGGEVVLGLFVGVMSVLYFFLARGLWQLKNWARILLIVLHGLSIVSGLVRMGIGLSDADPSVTICGAAIGLAISGYIIYWFASHGEYFS